jgi:predicted aspartyl protease
MFTIGKSTPHPFLTDILVNGKRIRMEIDTGAAVSIISKDQQKLLLPDAIIEELPIKLKTYTGEICLSLARSTRT